MTTLPHYPSNSMSKLAAGDIAFGSNSWRGDQYEPHLRKAILNHEAKA
jgi:hypothetical protein